MSDLYVNFTSATHHVNDIKVCQGQELLADCRSRKLGQLDVLERNYINSENMSAEFQNINFPRETIRPRLFKEWITFTANKSLFNGLNISWSAAYHLDSDKVSIGSLNNRGQIDSPEIKVPNCLLLFF